jgi:hypothetical protein
MADKTPAPPQNPQLQLTANDVVGALQRLLKELTDIYLWTPIEQIDPAIIMAFLHRAADFTAALPSPVSPAGTTGAGADDGKGRKG